MAEIRVASIAATVNQSGGASATAGLEAQLARSQKELSNCVNCESAKTRAGKENIQKLTNEIANLKARIEAASQARDTQRHALRSDVDSQSVKTPREVIPNTSEAAAVRAMAPSETQRARQILIVGSAVDVFG